MTWKALENDFHLRLNGAFRRGLFEMYKAKARLLHRVIHANSKKVYGTISISKINEPS